MTFELKQIGRVCADEEGFCIVIDKEYRQALRGLDEFSHIQAVWWFDKCDNAETRATLTEDKPYTRGPERLGVFATRSPERPNPIALSCAGITYVDIDNGVIGIDYIDAEDGSPVLDIKPYTLSLDYAQSAGAPAWCAHWPKSREESGEFDWESEFNF